MLTLSLSPTSATALAVTAPLCYCRSSGEVDEVGIGESVCGVGPTSATAVTAPHCYCRSSGEVDEVGVGESVCGVGPITKCQVMQKLFGA